MKVFWEIDNRIAKLERERRAIVAKMKMHDPKKMPYKGLQLQYDKITAKINELNWVLYE